MTTPTPPPSRRRLWIVVAVVAAVAIVIAVLLVVPNLRTKVVIGPTPSPTPTASTATPAAAPSGCLGGSARDAAMLTSAQQEASHTTTGAVEVAAAFVRWTFRHPTPTADEANQASASIIASTASDSFKNLAASAAANPNPSGGAVADGTDFYVSTAPGVWYLDRPGKDEVTVSVGAGYVVNGTLNPSLRSSSTFTLVWERGAWRIQSGSLDHTTEELFRIGTPFSGGC